MKNLLYPLVFALSAFLFVYSCSAEEEDTTPPPQVQQPNLEPEVTQFTLTVAAGEGGTVSTEGGTYDEGTEITITATPAEGYDFIGWEGSDSPEASLTITLGENTTLNALFGQLPVLILPSSPSKMFTKGVADTLSIGFISASGFKSVNIEVNYGIVEVLEQPNEGLNEGNIIIQYNPLSIENVDYLTTIAGYEDISISFFDQNEISTNSTYRIRTQPEPLKFNYLKSSHELQHHSLYKIDFGRIREINGKANTYSCSGTRPETNYKNGLDQDCLTTAAVFDINLDGYEDFILPPTFCWGPQENFSTQKIELEVYIYKDGEFILNSNDIFSNSIPKPYLGRKAFSGDFDGDGDGDAFIACTGIDQQPYPREIEPSLLLINEFNENGKIRVVEINEYSSLHEAASGDIDNDGDLDIFSAGFVNPDRFEGYHHGLILNDGNGNFIRANNITYYDNKITDHIWSIFSNVNSSEIIDIDNDGYNDILYGGNEFIGTLSQANSGYPKILWGTQDFTFDSLDKTLIPNVSGFGVICDLDSYDLDNDGTKEIVLLRTGDNLDEDGQLFNSGGEFSNTFIGQSFYYGGYYIQIVKIVDREAIDVTLDFISDNFNRTPNRMWSGCDYNSSWIRWLTIGDYDNNGQIDLYTPLFYEVGPGEKIFKRWEWNGSKFLKVSP